MENKPFDAPTDSLNLPWSDMVRFVRQLSHDLRNDFNAIELQSAYIGELAQDQELTSEIKRLREVVSGMNSTLQLLSKAVGEVTPNLVSYPAGEFVTDMRALTLPADAPPGEYTLWAGMYDPATGDRLTTDEFPEGRVRLGTVRVGP